MMTPQQILKRMEKLESERRNLDQVYDLISRFVIPGKGKFFTGGDTEDSVDWRHREIYDSTAIVASQQLAATINSTVTNPSTKWFEWGFVDEDLNKDDEALRWLEESSNYCYRRLQDSNLDMENNELFLDDVTYGVAFMMHEGEYEGTSLKEHKFQAVMMREAYFEEGWDGTCSAFYRRRKYSALQLAEKFGEEALPDKIRDEMDKPAGVETKHEVIFCVYKRHDINYKDVDRTKPLADEQRPVVARYVLREGAMQLGEDMTYYEMPAYVLRWSRTAGSKFGHSPAINCLSNIMTANQLIEYTLISAEKVIDPPALVPDRGIVSDLDLQAGGLTVCRDPDAIKPYESRARFDVGQVNLKEMQTFIRETFYQDQLQLKDSPAMTATEVSARWEIMQRLMGPSLSRMRYDYLDPMLTRTFYMELRAGNLPEMPQILKERGGSIEIEYIGPLARTQKQDAINAAQQWITMILQGAELDQELLDLPNWDNIGRDSAKRLGVPADYVNGVEVVKRKRDARKNQEQQAQQIAQAQAGSEVLSNIADAASVATAGELG